jgi:hypothetical protein
MATRGRAGDPARRRYWRDVIERWRQSGQAVRAFCQAEGIKKASFYSWRQRLARRCLRQGARCRQQESGRQGKPTGVTARAAGPDPQDAARFLPLQVTVDQASQCSSGVEIHWDNGRSVRLCRQFDRQTLVEVLAVLEARPC